MLRILIAEDDMVSKRVMQKILSNYGQCDTAINGMEAIDDYMKALEDNHPYDLVCLDIMMPKVDGVTVLRTIRDVEKQKGITNPCRIIMATALSDSERVDEAFKYGADAYAPKPVNVGRMSEVLKNFKLI